MAVYQNTKADSTLAAVEFSPVPQGNFSFFYIKLPPQPAAAPSAADAEPNAETLKWEESKKQIAADTRQWLASEKMEQKIVAETMVDGKLVFVTQGNKDKDGIMKSLEERGDKMKLQAHKKPVNFWALRGGLSVAGHALHFTAALLGVEKLGKGHAKLNPNNAHYNPKLKEGMYIRKSFQPDIGVFAGLNQIANFANIALGHQHENGDNRLHAVKEELNKALGPQLLIEDPIPVSDNRSKLRNGPQQPPSALDKVMEFSRENSVRFFEIFLRTLGTTALIVPWKKANLAKGWSALQKGELAKAWKAIENTDKFYRNAGWTYLAGKAMTFSAKTPDPYDDKPHTTLDTIREKVLFKLGTIAEFGAAAQMAHHAFGHKKIGFSDPKRPDIQPHSDFFSGVGGSLFAVAFIARFFAPFGKKEVDMDEIYAHATDTLAKTPPEKMPQLIADTSALLKEHFKDKPEIEFGSVFTKMMTDLYRYHPIALDLDKHCDAVAQTQPEEKKPSVTAHTAHEKLRKPHLVASSPRDLMDRATVPTANHAEDALKSPAAQLSI